MSLELTATLCVAFFVVATLYSTVGHAGASGYLAIMALASVAPEVMRPTALALNILVATVTVYRFHRARFVFWSNLWPFLLGSVPLAAVGGSISLPRSGYYALVGAVLQWMPESRVVIGSASAGDRSAPIPVLSASVSASAILDMTIPSLDRIFLKFV